MTSYTNEQIVKKEYQERCKCDEFYASDEFENNCSQCFYKINPSKYLEIFKSEPCKYHTDSFLYNHVFKNKIPSNSLFYKILEAMIIDKSILNLDNFFNWIKTVKKNTEFKGIGVSQAKKLLNKFSNLSKNNKEKIKLEHIICGIILDWWNLDKHSDTFIIGCYYSNGITKYDKRFECMKYDKELKLPIGFVGKEDLPAFEFWLEFITYNYGNYGN